MTAQSTDTDYAAAAKALDTALPQLRWQQVAQAIADARAEGYEAGFRQFADMLAQSGPADWLRWYDIGKKAQP